MTIRTSCKNEKGKRQDKWFNEWGFEKKNISAIVKDYFNLRNF